MNKYFLSKTNIFLILLLSLFAGVFVFSSFRYDFATLSGQKYKHSEFEDQVLVVNYFAEWCAPCLREIPELNAFYRQMPPGVALFAVSYDNLSNEKLLKIKQQYNIEFPLINEIKHPFNFKKPAYLPATFVIKPSGELAGQLLGEQTVKSLNEATQLWNRR